MQFTELKRTVRLIRADVKKQKEIDALLKDARQARERLAKTPPKQNDLGGPHLVEADMSPREFEVCEIYHALLICCFDRAISIRKSLEESTGLEKKRFQADLAKFSDQCWAAIDVPCRWVVLKVYFLIMLPYVYALMKVLKQRKKIKPTKKIAKDNSCNPSAHGTSLAAIAGVHAQRLLARCDSH